MPSVYESQASLRAIPSSLDPSDLQKVNKILSRAELISADILQKQEENLTSLSNQNQIIHHYHYSSPHWWFYSPPSIHHHHYAASSTSKKKGNEFFLVGGILLLLGGAYVAAKDVATTWSLKRISHKLDKQAKDLVELPEQNSKGEKIIAKIQKIVLKEKKIIDRIQNYTNWALFGKSALAVSGATAITGYFLESDHAMLGAVAGTCAASFLLLVNWGLSGYMAERNLEDAKKIQKSLKELESR